MLITIYSLDFFALQIVAKGMIARGTGGSIVNVSSQAGIAALADHAVYGSTKAGLDYLTKVMGLELGPHKVNVHLTLISTGT